MAVDMIYHATFEQNRKIRNCLESGVHVDARNFFGETSLLFAAKNGHPSSVRLLLDHGADPNR